MPLRFSVFLLAGATALATPASQTPPQRPPANTPLAPPQAKPSPDEPAKKARDPENELGRAISEAGNDRAALVRKLEQYLTRFPDAPRKAAVYRALVEACEQLHNYPCALAYVERLIAINPDDFGMMLAAVGLLDQQGDAHSRTKAIGYIGRVLDQREKMTPAEKPPQISLADWKLKQTKLRVSLYLRRGKLEMEQHDDAAAARDFETSYHLKPNAPAAERLGEIAETHKDLQAAIADYMSAFVLPESIPDASVDRREVRQKLGNVWRQLHDGQESGLGDAVLAAYDQLREPSKVQDSAAQNRDAWELFAFVLRRLDGSPLPLAPLRGKVVVLNFWATWCGPCRMLEPLFARVARDFAAETDVVFFAVNTDEDEMRVRPFAEREKMATPVVFADGLDDFLGVRSLPTIVVLDRTGRIVYRIEGLDAEGFIPSLTAALEKALRPAG